MFNVFKCQMRASEEPLEEGEMTFAELCSYQLRKKNISGNTFILINVMIGKFLFKQWQHVFTATSIYGLSGHIKQAITEDSCRE